MRTLKVATGCRCGQVVMFSLYHWDGSGPGYTRCEITHTQWRGHPAAQIIFRQECRVPGSFPENVESLAEDMNATLRRLLMGTGCLARAGSTRKARGNWV